jgi:hypothetical protein
MKPRMENAKSAIALHKNESTVRFCITLAWRAAPGEAELKRIAKRSLGNGTSVAEKCFTARKSGRQPARTPLHQEWAEFTWSPNTSFAGSFSDKAIFPASVWLREDSSTEERQPTGHIFLCPRFEDNMSSIAA